jgi:hypothetical protein
MARERTGRSSQFKAKVALAALKERRTVSELASEHGVHPTQVHQWKKRLLESAADLFQDGWSRKGPAGGGALRSTNPILHSVGSTEACNVLTDGCLGDSLRPA